MRTSLSNNDPQSRSHAQLISTHIFERTCREGDFQTDELVEDTFSLMDITKKVEQLVDPVIRYRNIKLHINRNLWFPLFVIGDSAGFKLLLLRLVRHALGLIKNDGVITLWLTEATPGMSADYQSFQLLTAKGHITLRLKMHYSGVALSPVELVQVFAKNNHS